MDVRVSRSRHPRPPAQTGDELSRVTQAAIALADDITRMGRAQERLARAVTVARDAGHDDGHLNGAIVLAMRGRPDRRKALDVYLDAGRKGAAS